MKLESLLHSADGYFSKYIRLRGSNNGYATCFTCGYVDIYTNMDCGHFISRKNYLTRYDEYNCQVQCRICNQYLKGNLEVFERNLIEKYGPDLVDKLNASRYKIKKFTHAEVIDIIEYYKGKLNDY